MIGAMLTLAITLKAHSGIRLAEVGEALGAIGGLAFLVGGLTPFGNLIVGPIADRIGVQTTLAGCALITILVCCVVGLRSRGLRELHATGVATPA